MARRCEISGKAVLVGNNVSHANNKTKRRFLPNLQEVTFTSEYLGAVSLRLTTHALSTIEKNGGLDAYLLGKGNSKLSCVAKDIKKRILKKQKAA